MPGQAGICSLNNGSERDKTALIAKAQSSAFFKWHVNKKFSKCSPASNHRGALSMMDIKLALWSSLIIITMISCTSAENLIFCDSIREKPVNWNSSITLPKFDPEMGTLKKVDLLCTMNLSQEIMVENKDSNPADFNMSISGALVVKLTSSENIFININHSSKGNLSAYDGVMDDSGTSGITSSANIPTEAASKSISNFADFIAGSPGESITIPVAIIIASQMKVPASSSSELATKAGAQVCVSYTYDEKSIKDGGEA